MAGPSCSMARSRTSVRDAPYAGRGTKQLGKQRRSTGSVPARWPLRDSFRFLNTFLITMKKLAGAIPQLKSRIIRLVLISLALSFGPCTVLSQDVSPDFLSGLRWRLIGPFRGGRAVAVCGAPGDSKTFYFGAVDGGVWKTTDAGTVWVPIFDDQPIASIGAIEVAPS